jgi:hypothetical protein
MGAAPGTEAEPGTEPARDQGAVSARRDDDSVPREAMGAEPGTRRGVASQAPTVLSNAFPAGSILPWCLGDLVVNIREPWRQSVVKR